MTYYDEFAFKNGRILVVDEDGNAMDFCEEVRVTHVFIDYHTGHQTVELTVTMPSGQTTSCIRPRSVIADDPLSPLTDCGLSVPKVKDYVVTLSEILFDTEKSAPRSYIHRNLGFCSIGRKQVFLAHHPIGCRDPLRAASEFHDSAKTRPRGTLDSWRSVMIREVVGHPNLELALALSVTAPISHLLCEADKMSLIPIWALIGTSSTGKTTALKLMASVWGSPRESSGLITDLNTTQNAFFAQLGSICGLPALIDETSSAPEWDFTKVLYNLPKGRDKLRCSSDGSVRPSIYYSGAIIFTGEKTLFDQTTGNQGLTARLVEFTLPWTDDAAHAQRLEYGIKRNYGTAVYPLIKYLLHHKSLLPKVLLHHYEHLKQELGPCSGVEDRLLASYALICVAAQIIRTSLKLPVDVVAIRTLLLDLHGKNNRIRNDPALIFERVKHQILQNYSYFPTNANTPRASKIWGEYDQKGFQSMFWVDASIFEEFLKNAGATDFKSIKYTFFERGWIARTPDRHYTLLHNLGGILTKCYRVYANIENYGPRPMSKLPLAKRQGSQLIHLLAEGTD